MTPVCRAALAGLLCTTLWATEIYVSPAGRDDAPGTKEQPLAALNAGRYRARAARLKSPEQVTVILRGGTYVLSETLRLTPEDVDIYDYAHKLVQRNRHLAEQKDITLCLDLEPDLPLIRFDPHRIQQVMDNLLSNAVKFSHPDTQITLHIVKTLPNEIEIAVIDQGQGNNRSRIGNDNSRPVRHWSGPPLAHLARRPLETSQNDSTRT